MIWMLSSIPRISLWKSPIWGWSACSRCASDVNLWFFCLHSRWIGSQCGDHGKNLVKAGPYLFNDEIGWSYWPMCRTGWWFCHACWWGACCMKQWLWWLYLEIVFGMYGWAVCWCSTLTGSSDIGLPSGIVVALPWLPCQYLCPLKLVVARDGCLREPVQ